MCYIKSQGGKKEAISYSLVIVKPLAEFCTCKSAVDIIFSLKFKGLGLFYYYVFMNFYIAGKVLIFNIYRIPTSNSGTKQCQNSLQSKSFAFEVYLYHFLIIKIIN